MKSVVFLLLMCVFSAPYLGAAGQGSMEMQIFNLVNQHRQSTGLQQLQYCDECAKEALKHSQKMASGKIPMSHQGFDKRFEVLHKSINAMGMGENVAYGQQTAEQVMASWLKSKGHRKNIEGNFKLIGVGIAKSADGTLYFTQVFVRK